MYRKKNATPAGCVRSSQAGTKLGRTQTAVGLLRFSMQVLLRICLRKRKSVLQFDATTHDKHYWSSWFFWHRRYGRMLIDPAHCGLLEPRAQLNPCNVRYPSTVSSSNLLRCVGQHIVHLQRSRGLICKLAHVNAGLWGCVGWHAPPELQSLRRELLIALCLANKLCTELAGYCATFCWWWRERRTAKMLIAQ